ncbi:MAG TPA: hypothetical protein VNJ02_04055 [Vicinamibacterales bacterium]|nr:hypothetical protein [Vicinamibacterales bacterium]
MLGPPDASAFLTTSFYVFTIALVLSIIALVHRANSWQDGSTGGARWTALFAVGAAAWLALTWVVAANGTLAEFDRRPPPLVLLAIAIFALSITLAFSRVGARLATLPFAWLVVAQAFRLPLELLMHRAADERVMPIQMSYSGRNFDIATGATALIVAALLAAGFGGRKLVAGWNVLGTALLANILYVAIISTPVFAAFGPDNLNTWVAYPPFVWLPTVMVVWALTGHLIIFRKLAKGSRG